MKKALQRRVSVDRSQRWRYTIQVAFLALNVWIGVQFYLWVRQFEVGAQALTVTRPAGVEGWLPIAALMNLKYLLYTGTVPPLHAAGMFILISFLAISFLLRKTFCSWLCPVGTISEWLWRLGQSTFGRTWSLPRVVDIPLRSLKYVLLCLFGYAVGSMASPDIALFLQGPYGLVADVKMLNFFRYMSTGAAITIGILLIASVFVQNAWCRYLCPYGALMGIVSMISPMRIRRNAEPCIDCGKCAKACPTLLPVDQLVQIRSAECTACMACVAVCPAEGALELSVVRRRPIPPWAVAAGIIVIFFSVYSWAQYMNYWDTRLPASVYLDLVPRASEFSHP